MYKDKLKNMENISRKKFLKTVGSIVAGGAIAGVSGAVINKNMQNGRLSIATVNKGKSSDDDDGFVSAYRQITSFGVQGAIEAFDEYDGKLYAVVENGIAVVDYDGKLLSRFVVEEGTTRDMAVASDGIYLLRPASIQVYSHAGELLREWSACSPLSDYCSFTLAEDFVFVTDKDNKNLCKYTREGVFVKFISSPDRFIIPSLTYGVVYANNRIYCSNSGRHQVEIYSLDGEYQGAFGSAGGAQGYFCGCCNPVHLTLTPTGEIITSEKGNPRISCYGADGRFRSMLLDSRALGGGNVAFEAKVANDKLFVASKDKIAVFAYAPQMAVTDACAGCGINCGLKHL
jgi:hypothetical protein